MERLELMPRELVFLAATVGGREFYGLPDPFFGMEAHEIKQEIAEIKFSLEQKGYAEMGFDGSFSVKEDVLAIATVCAKCERYLYQEFAGKNKFPKRVFYGLQDENVMMDVIGDHVALCRCSKLDLKAVLLERIVQREASGALGIEQQDVVLSFRQLSTMHTLSVKSTAKALACLPDTEVAQHIGRIMLEAFDGQACYCANVLNDFQARQMKSVVCIQSSQGILELISETTQEQEDGWRLRFVDVSRISSALMALVDDFLEGVRRETG